MIVALLWGLSRRLKLSSQPSRWTRWSVTNLAGKSVKDLAERLGIHRATVFSHLRRRNVPSRRLGLGLDENAEAVRLARAGVSMRASARRMGVDRKAVRAALVEAGVIVDDANKGMS